MICEYEDKIFRLNSIDFEALALEIFHHQAELNPVYSKYISNLQITPSAVRHLEEIPFLPIQFFKTQQVVSGSFEPEIVFESSGTTGTIQSKHIVRHLDLYHLSFEKAFRLFYGPIEDYCIIGLLPSYLERKHSSLVVMVDELIRRSEHPSSGFYLYEFERLAGVLAQLEASGQKTILIGVTFALLDFAEQFSMKFQSTIIMETGGMKGRKKEMTRSEVHDILKAAFGIKSIHAEYGMTELLSQAYSKGAGIFHCPPWMKILLRDEDDPFAVHTNTRGRAGIINVIDLANLHSCSFIATDDIGRLQEDGGFEVLGRVDYSDIRGCSLMVG